MVEKITKNLLKPMKYLFKLMHTAEFESYVHFIEQLFYARSTLIYARIFTILYYAFFLIMAVILLLKIKIYARSTVIYTRL